MMAGISPKLIRRVLRFGCVGLIVMLAFVGLNALFGRWWSGQVAFLVAYPVAVTIHFLLNKWWTFEAGGAGGTGRQVRDYVVMVAVTFMIQWGVFTGLTAWTTLAAWLAAGIANVVQMGITFVAMQRRVFAPARTVPPTRS